MVGPRCQSAVFRKDRNNDNVLAILPSKLVRLLLCAHGTVVPAAVYGITSYAPLSYCMSHVYSATYFIFSLDCTSRCASNSMSHRISVPACCLRIFGSAPFSSKRQAFAEINAYYLNSFLYARYRCGDRAVLDLNTWLAAAAEDAEGHDQDTAPSASAATLDRARLDLDPPGFLCKTFQDLTVRLLRLWVPPLCIIVSEWLYSCVAFHQGWRA